MGFPVLQLKGYLAESIFLQTLKNQGSGICLGRSERARRAQIK